MVGAQNGDCGMLEGADFVVMYGEALVGPFREVVVLRGGEEKICALGET